MCHLELFASDSKAIVPVRDTTDRQQVQLDLSAIETQKNHEPLCTEKSIYITAINIPSSVMSLTTIPLNRHLIVQIYESWVG